MKLSILICSTDTRRNNFLPKILDQVFEQYYALPKEDQNEVEVLVLLDNKKMMLGEKRNHLVSIAKGEYYVFVDDDDRIESTYISDILEATKSDADVITFKASVSINGGDPKICVYDKNFEKDYNTHNEYHRLPNHICVVKRSVGSLVSFPNIKYGEDSAYSKILKPLLKTQHNIDKVLYHYDFNENTTETQDHIKASKIISRDTNPVCDAVFLSNSKSDYYKRMTQEAIDSCLRGANGLKVNVIVIEQNIDVTHENCTTVHNISKFAYNRFMNQGARMGGAEWILFANNDLVFYDGWLHELLIAGNDLVSPHEPFDPRQRGLIGNELGTTNGRHLSGWCFMMRRSLWEKIRGLDEDFDGWYADDATIEQAIAVGVTPMVVKNSKVRHLGSQTIHGLTEQEKDDLYWSKLDLFNKKYGKDKFKGNVAYEVWKSKQK